MTRTLSWSDWVSATLTGVGQIMLCQSSVTGVLFLAGMLLYSPVMAIAAAIAALIGTATASWLGYDQGQIKQGLFGFNAALVGIAVVFFFPLGVWSVLLGILGAAVSSVVMRAMQNISRFATPAYTAPFVVTTWAVWAIGHKLLHLGSIEQPEGFFFRDSPAGLLHGIGQVMFQNEAASGLLFLVGVLVALKVRGLWALGGSAVGGLLAFAIGAPLGLIAQGIFGYNGSLAALATREDRPTLLTPVIAAALTVPLLYGFLWLGLPALTAPFVLATWLTRWLQPRLLDVR